MKNLKYILAFLFLVVGLRIYAQSPTHVPKPDRSPVDFSQLANIVLFIILPLLIVVFYFMWRNKKRKDETEQE